MVDRKRDTDDVEDARSRADNLRHLENARRTMMVGGRWFPLHAFRATTSERIMTWIGAIMLVAIVGALVLERLGFLHPPHR